MAAALPAIPGLRDLGALLAYLDEADRQKKWLADAREVVKANREAARLLDAPATIEQNLKLAQTDRTKAAQALDHAHIEARSIVAAAEDGLGKRTAELEAREKAFNESMAIQHAELKTATDEFEERSQEKTIFLNAFKEKLEGDAADLAEREAAIEGRETRADALAERGRAAKAEADALIEGMRALVPSAAA